MGDTPKISVLLPVRNPHPVYFPAAVQSVLDQTEKDLELLIVEDLGERPAAPQLARFADPRIHHLQNPRRDRLGAALNFGLHAARAPLVARMDADDVCEPRRLERQLAFLDAHPQIDLLGGQIAVIDEGDRRTGYRSYPIEHLEIVRALRRYNCFSHPSVVFRRDPVVALGGYQPGMLNEDYDLWCRMARAGMRLGNLPEVVVHYRLHPGAQKNVDVHEIVRVTMAIKRQYFGEELDLAARLRMIGERALLYLPPLLIIKLFERVQYRRQLSRR